MLFDHMVPDMDFNLNTMEVSDSDFSILAGTLAKPVLPLRTRENSLAHKISHLLGSDEVEMRPSRPEIMPILTDFADLESTSNVKLESSPPPIIPKNMCTPPISRENSSNPPVSRDGSLSPAWSFSESKKSKPSEIVTRKTLPLQHKAARGRGRKRQLKNMSEEQIKEEALDRAARNRLAAKECRARRKDRELKLKKRVTDLEAREKISQKTIKELLKKIKLLEGAQMKARKLR